MTGLEYMDSVCPTTSVGKDPNREDVADAFEDGIAEGYKQAMKDAEKRIRSWERDFDDHYLTFDNCGYARIMQAELEEDMIKVIKGEGV